MEKAYLTLEHSCLCGYILVSDGQMNCQILKDHLDVD